MITLILNRVKRVNDRSRLFNYQFKLAKKHTKAETKTKREIAFVNLIFLFIFSFDSICCGAAAVAAVAAVHFLCANFDWIVKQKVISINWHWHSIIRLTARLKCKIAQFHLYMSKSISCWWSKSILIYFKCLMSSHKDKTAQHNGTSFGSIKWELHCVAVVR